MNKMNKTNYILILWKIPDAHAGNKAMVARQM